MAELMIDVRRHKHKTHQPYNQTRFITKELFFIFWNISNGGFQEAIQHFITPPEYFLVKSVFIFYDNH